MDSPYRSVQTSTCAGCRFYAPLTDPEVFQRAPEARGTGFCRRFAPKVRKGDMQAFRTKPADGSYGQWVAPAPSTWRFPSVYASDWCGEFQQVT